MAQVTSQWRLTYTIQYICPECARVQIDEGLVARPMAGDLRECPKCGHIIELGFLEPAPPAADARGKRREHENTRMSSSERREQPIKPTESTHLRGLK